MVYFLHVLNAGICLSVVRYILFPNIT